MLDNKPRDYGYIGYKDRYPLELTGTMKKKCRSNLMKQNLRQFNSQMNTISFGKNQVDRQKFLQKIVQNYEDVKSIVPMDLEPSRKTCSKKICHPDNYIGFTGAPYLMIKSNNSKDHPQRRHIDQKMLENSPKKETEKKHFQNKFGKQSSNQWKSKRPHTATLEHKIIQDLYSNVNRRQRAFSSTVRMSRKNMFQEGSKLGYEKEKQKRISCSKHQEMMGSYSKPLHNHQSRSLRDDWRRSSIVLG